MRNEDAFICEPPLFAVADGMGGARAGEIAAGLAAAALEEAGEEMGGAAGMAELIEEANRRIWERSLTDPQTAGMGTTVTAALVDATGGTVAIGHVGDSRAYLLRGDTIEQLTTDHSLVAELVESGILTPEEAERHPQRSAITRALGTEPTVDVDAFTIEAAPGDLFLLCSDGLSTMVAEEDVVSAIESAGRDPAGAAEALIAAANARGGEDNITAVLFEIVEVESTPEEEPAEAVATPDPIQDEAGEDETDGEATEAGVQRHGAGKGGRLAALLLVAATVGVGLLVLYWGVTK
jgi:protein phosphatase